MPIDDTHLRLIRECSKDEAASTRLLDLFEQVVSQDATKTETEQHLRRTEANLRAMLSSTWHSFTLIDSDGCIVDADDKGKQSARAIFGKDMQAGDSIYDFVLPRDHESFTSNFGLALQGEQITVEKHFSLPDRSERCFEIAYFPVTDDQGDVIGVCMSHQDITQRKHMEAKMRRYRNIISSTSDGFSLVNTDYVYEIVNDAYLQRMQQKREDIEGHHVAEVMGQAAFDMIIKPHLDRCLNGEIVTYAEWFEYVGQGRRYVQVTYIPYYNEDGKLDGVVVHSQDITEHMVAQQREMELALEKERFKLLARFIRYAAHEFRTPLATIETSAYLMSRADEADRRKTKLEQIQKQIEHLAHLIDMLLMMVRLETTVLRSPPMLDINEAVDVACDELAARYSQHVPLRRETVKPLPQIAGDADLLTEMLRQLIDNAYRYTPDDGTITLKTGTEDGHVWIELDDNGPGINRDDLTHVFETFWRQDLAHTLPGFGLGLPIALKIADLHGGTIDIQSEAGKGAHVRVKLPIKHHAD
jgi:PAS domain S-box-containing protein